MVLGFPSQRIEAGLAINICALTVALKTALARR